MAEPSSSDRSGARTGAQTGRGKAPPWWAEGGSELCPFCEQTFVYEMEVRCVDCDRPACPHCACCDVVESLTVMTHRCPECVAPEGEG